MVFLKILATVVIFPLGVGSTKAVFESDSLFCYIVGGLFEIGLAALYIWIMSA